MCPPGVCWKKYQLERFRRRLKRPDKHWKFNPDDLKEREL